MLNFYLIFLEILFSVFHFFFIKEANEHNSFIYLANNAMHNRGLCLK